MTSVQEAKRSIGAGDRAIGAMVYWTALTDVRIARTLYRQGFTSCGLQDALTADPKAEKVLNIAVGIANRRQGGADATGYAELKHKTDTEVAYQVVMRRDLSDRARYLEEARIRLDRGQHAPRPVVDVDPRAPQDESRDRLVDTIVDQYTELLAYADTQEVSKALVCAVRDVCSGLTLKAGFYLVRTEYLPQLMQLQKFMTSEMGANLEIWEIKTTDVNKAAAQRNAKESLRESLNVLLAEVEAFRTEHTDPEKVAAKSVNAQVKRFRELDGKVQLYADILGGYARDLTKAITTAKQEFVTAYCGDDAS